MERGVESEAEEHGRDQHPSPRMDRTRHRTIQVAGVSSYRHKNHCTVFASTAEDTDKRSSHRCDVHCRYDLD